MKSIMTTGVLLWALSGGPAALADPPPGEATYLAENQRVMNKMMAGMNAKPSGDVDRDFATMMIPHHQGAIDMALLELRYGHNEQLRRLAQGIVVDQQQEITVMRQILGELSPPSGPAPDQPAPAAPGMTMPMGGPGARQ